jgi:hypothetical protein
VSNAPGSLMVELWFEHEPQLDPRDVAAAVPHAESKGDLIIHPRFVQEPVEGDPAALGTSLLRGGGSEREFAPTAEQTWDWDEAEETLSRCSHSLLVAELLGRYHPFRDRLEAFLPTLRAAIAVTRPAALWCPNSTRIVTPAFEHDHSPFVNVRMFRGEDFLLMDTLGLHVLGLRDFQCRFTDRAPGEIAAALLNLAGYALEHGDVIEDGDTMGEEYWRCRHDVAIVAPEREVVDLEPS